MPAHHRLGGNPGVRVVHIAPPHRQHRMDDVVGVFREMRVERTQKLLVTPDLRHARRAKLDSNAMSPVKAQIQLGCGIATRCPRRDNPSARSTV